MAPKRNDRKAEEPLRQTVTRKRTSIPKRASLGDIRASESSESGIFVPFERVSSVEVNERANRRASAPGHLPKPNSKLVAQAAKSPKKKAEPAIEEESSGLLGNHAVGPKNAQELMEYDVPIESPPRRASRVSIMTPKAKESKDAKDEPKKKMATPKKTPKRVAAAKPEAKEPAKKAAKLNSGKKAKVEAAKEPVEEDADADGESVSEEEEFYDIEHIVNHKRTKDGIKYFIKWQGWPASANTWEPAMSLLHCPELVEQYFESLFKKAEDKAKKAEARAKPKTEDAAAAPEPRATNKRKRRN